ncbi:hypothetical protein Hanom_Chr06g00543321 [Helianthus anomalus]
MKPRLYVILLRWRANFGLTFDESRRNGLKHERITGREKARNRIRARTHEVSDFRNHFLVQVSNKVLKLIKHDI